MPPGSYSTQHLMGLVPSLNVPALFLRNTFFPNVALFDTEEVYWDKLHDELRIAPFVTPLSEAPVVEDGQDSTEYIIPPYAKFKWPIKPKDLLRRTSGERLTGELTPVQRKDAKLMQLMNKSESMFARREELMASEILRTGQLTITGKGYPSRVINYNRAASLTEVMAGAALWTAGTSDPLGDLTRWSMLAQMSPLGGPLRRYVFEPEVRRPVQGAHHRTRRREDARHRVSRE